MIAMLSAWMSGRPERRHGERRQWDDDRRDHDAREAERREPTDRIEVRISDLERLTERLRNHDA